MFMYLFRQLMHCLKKNMNFTSDEEINIPFIRLTSHNDVFKCIGLRQTFCNNRGRYFVRLKLPVISCTSWEVHMQWKYMGFTP